jgi:hypothetical protein
MTAQPIHGAFAAREVQRWPHLPVLLHRPDAYATLAARLTRLVDEPWDAWQVQPGGGEPEFREIQFGEHGILSFRVDSERRP